MRRLLTLIAILSVLIVAAGTVEAAVVAEIDRIRDGELVSTGFELTKGAEIDIDAVGMRQGRGRSLAVYAWILDYGSREVVWSMTLGNTSRHERYNYLRQAEKAMFLEAGRYELYMHAVDQWHYGNVVHGVKDFYDILEDLFDDDDDDYGRWDRDEYDWEDHIRDCYVKVSSDELEAGDFSEYRITGDHADALVQFNQLGDDEYVYQGFTLDQAMNVRLYALVEHPRGNKQAVDYGWIVNLDNRERVWEIDRWNTERAGGGRKNRKFDDEIRLDAGRYALHYVTDIPGRNSI
jgi:hypothetical protein